MGFFQRFFNTKNVDRKEYVKQRLESVTSSAPSFDFSQPELCSSVYTSISIIANSISKLPLAIYKTTEKGKELHTTHPWFNSIRYSPDQISTSKWLNNAITQMYLSGNYFALKQDFEDMDINRKLKSLGEVENIVSDNGKVFYKFKNSDSWFPAEKLVHFYLISKDNGITGINPIAAIRNEIEIQHSAESVVKNYYKNGTFSVLYMEVDLESAVTTNDKNKLKEYAQKIENDYSGYANSGKILRIPPSYKLKSLPMPDLKFLESSKYTISQIAALFQVPKWMLGAQENSGSYAKAEQEQISFLNNCLANVCNIIRSELEAKLLTIEERNNGVFIDFDYSKLFTTDLSTKATYLKTLSGIGAITPNEIRSEFSMPKIENQFMDETYLQKQYVPVSMMGTINHNTGQFPQEQSEQNDNDNKEI